MIRNNIANSIATVEGPRAGLEAWRDSVEFARRRGSEEFVSAGLQGEVECLTLLGRWDEALSQADALRPALVDANDFTSLAFLNACALLIELARGRTDLATMGDPLVAYARAYNEAQVIFGIDPTRRPTQAHHGWSGSGDRPDRTGRHRRGDALRPHLCDQPADERSERR